MNLLIIDNYDSYTFNLFQFACIDNPPPVVLRNNQITEEELDKILPHFDAVILSPGPGRPEKRSDFGLCGHVLETGTLPVLGVCLGHQGLAHVFGGIVQHAQEPMHGRLSAVVHDGSGLFKDIPSPFQVVRYHSLVVADNVPHSLKVTARTGDVVMALEHRHKPFWGVQFHPESICTEHGPEIIRNFCKLAKLRNPGMSSVLPEHVQRLTMIPSSLIPPLPLDASTNVLEKQCFIMPVRIHKELERIMETVFLEEPVFWLDSAKVEGSTRFSFLGTANGPLAWSFYYYNDERRLVLHRNLDGQRVESSVVLGEVDLFQWVAFMLQRYQLKYQMAKNEHGTEFDELEKMQVPFPFVGGLVGYFGYEMSSFDDHAVHPSSKLHQILQQVTHTLFSTSQPCKLATETAHPPDAAFMCTDRFIAHDHWEKQSWLVCISDNVPTEWFQQTITRIQKRHLVEPNGPSRSPSPQKLFPRVSTPVLDGFQLAHPRERYIDNIQRALDLIRDGESYEVCLTTQITARLPKNRPDALLFYRHLRDRNPAPYSAFLKFDASMVICCSSPERYLLLDREGNVSMKPIKGTRARCRAKTADPAKIKECQSKDAAIAKELETNEKDRAENLMIVDLIRNDLNLISESNSVHVPALMQVETYATVHQLVSTIASKLRKDLCAVDAVARCFPPGSMTGAPKKRTVEILRGLEGIPRGPYSGTLGYFSLDGAAHFNVVIRTAVLFGSTVSVGAGGAIVALSNPEAEFEEMTLKSNSVIPSLNDVYRISPPAP